MPETRRNGNRLVRRVPDDLALRLLETRNAEIQGSHVWGSRLDGDDIHNVLPDLRRKARCSIFWLTPVGRRRRKVVSLPKLTAERRRLPALVLPAFGSHEKRLLRPRRIATARAGNPSTRRWASDIPISIQLPRWICPRARGHVQEVRGRGDCLRGGRK